MEYRERIQELDRIERRDEAIFKCKELIRQARDCGDYHYKLFFEGKLQAINGLCDDALIKIRKAMELDPHNPEFLITAGNCCGNLSLYHEAIAYYDQAINLDNDNLTAIVHKANLLNIVGELRRALNVYDHALKLDPENLHVLQQKGVTLVKMGRCEKALDYLDKVLADNPQNFAALLHRGIALDELGKRDEALQDYQRAVGFGKDDLTLLTRLGNLYLKKGELEESLGYFDRVLILDPKNPAVLYQKGFALLKLGYYREALTFFDMSLALDASNKEAWKSKGEALTGAGDHEEGLRCFEEALKIDAGYLDSLLSKVGSLNITGQYKEAIQVIDRALEIDGEQWGLHIEKALALQGLGLFQQALDNFDIVLKYNHRTPKALFHKGLILERLGRFGEARSCFERVIEEAPQDVFTLHHLGYNLAKLGSHGEAIETFDEALLITPNNHEILSLKGFSLHEMGRHREALMYFNKVIDINPSHSSSILGKGRALVSLGKSLEALDCLESYYHNDPGSAAIILEIARLLAQLQRYREAISYYDRSLEIQPKNIEVLVLKAIAHEMIGEFEEAAKILYRIIKNMHGKDPRRAAFEYKYEYLSKYKREDPPRILKIEEIQQEIHERLINNVLNEFWKDEIESFQEEQQHCENLRAFIISGSDLQAEHQHYLFCFGDDLRKRGHALSEGFALSFGGKRMIVNPGNRFTEEFHNCPFRLGDIDALIITRMNPFTFQVLQNVFAFLAQRKAFYEEKARYENFLALQHKMHNLLRSRDDKGGALFDEIEKLLRGSNPLRAEFSSQKLDLILSTEVYGHLAAFLASRDEFVGNIHVLDISEDSSPRKYGDFVTLTAFPGRKEHPWSAGNPVNLIISSDNTHVFFAEALPSNCDLDWGNFKKGEILLIASVGTLKREDFDITRGFNDRLPGGKTGLLGISIYAKKLNPSLVLLSELEEIYSKKAHRLNSIISATLGCPSLRARPGLEISLIRLEPRCESCGNPIRREELLNQSLIPDRSPVDKPRCEECRKSSER